MSEPSREANLAEARELAWIKLVDELGREPNEQELEEELEAICDEYCWDWSGEEEEENNE